VAELLDMTIQHSTLIRAAPEQVYQALATAEGLDAWFTSGARVDPRPGGSIFFRWQDWGPDRVSGEERSPVLEAVPGSRFVFQWHPDNETYATTVEIDLEPAPEGTIVRLQEHGYQDTPSGREAFVNCATGWGEALTLLKFYLEHGLRY
jgi:uncharacterized protein YndB with AHSA1/START domain